MLDLEDGNGHLTEEDTVNLFSLSLSIFNIAGLTQILSAKLTVVRKGNIDRC